MKYRDSSIDEDSFSSELASIKYREKELKVKRGTAISTLMQDNPHPGDEKVIAAIINNRLVSLSAKIFRSGTIEPVDSYCLKGARLYQRHLSIMLYEVLKRLYPNARIQIGQAISEGHYFKIYNQMVTPEFIDSLTVAIKELSDQKKPFVLERVTVGQARRMFSKKGEQVKHHLLDQWYSSFVAVVRLGDFIDFCFTPVAPHTGYFSEFKIIKLEDDAFILQFPSYHPQGEKRNESMQPKLYAVHKEAKKWSGLMGVAHVSELNAAAIDGRIKDVIQISEGWHEKKISNIADFIVSNSDKKLVFIAGPSSSGKTTFAKRLSVQLGVDGVFPKSLSLDNYYVDREKTPMSEDGTWDFEALEAIDLERFNNDLLKILKGEQVLTPVYNFTTGKRAHKDKWIPVRLKENEVLIIEGIHGLNDALTSAISERDKFKIYINALNPLAIDNHNRLNTSDVRLIRRIVRDRHYRGYLASETIMSWNSVRRGERNHIFPFLEKADVIFDTSLIYEFSVLKVYAERYLLEVDRFHPAFAEAYRLRKFLALFVTVLPGEIPTTSLLREFIGGSSFSYK